MLSFIAGVFIGVLGSVLALVWVARNSAKLARLPW